ncbi:unnamed protein product [Cylicostephanus goldi]|uniref:Uncharacterized protein n=1 Tax=Cylicostephanus goldi TaxID=71465 RepID=A0A3P7QG83_CYLGO|nr:unnamed protein product [Cylicostephanus goldi]
MELVLRKRVCLNIYKKASLTERIRKRIVGADPLHRTAVYYDVVAHLPKLDRLRQEVAITNMLSRRDRHQRLSHLGLPSQSFRMKRAVSLPNTNSLVSLFPNFSKATQS